MMTLIYFVAEKSTLIGAGLPSPSMILFNRPIRALLPQVNRDIFNFNTHEPYEALKTK